MGAKVGRLKLRLFLEGVEVPVIAAQVQAESNSPAVASIQIPPLPEGNRLLPRTLVHLFFLDFYETANPLVSLRGKSSPNDEANNPTVYEQKVLSGASVDDELRQERYKLLFAGELVGFQWSKTSSQRSLVLQCQDLSNYWDYAQQWENTDLFGPGYKAMFSGGSTNMFTDFLSSEGEEIVQALLQPSVQFPKLKGLLGGIIHLLEKIGGTYYGADRVAGQNIFYSLAELRLHTTQMITAYADDDTAKKLLYADGYESLFGRVLGGLGQQVSFRQAINALMAVIFHETYPIPSPSFTPGTNGTVSGTKRRKVRGDGKLDFIAQAGDSAVAVLGEILADVKAGTKTTPRAAIVKRLGALRVSLLETSTRAKAAKVNTVTPIVSTVNSAAGRATSRIATAWVPGATPKVTEEIVTALNEAIENAKRLSRLEVVASDPKQAVPARLNSHIFRPDVWFTSPPRCNVLFPDHYSSFRYARNFMQEPTRLLLKTNDAFFGEDELFDQFYFAPKAVTAGTEKAHLEALLAGGIMSHELFTGILPVFEKMSETNIFAIRSGAIDGKMPKVGLAQRTANFLYFKYRFASRQLEVDARFNPFVAPGFPGLIVDKYVDLERLRNYNRLVTEKVGTQKEIRKQLGVHYLVNFGGVTHNVNQQGGTTRIAGSYARDYDESVEFLGAIEPDQTVKTKIGNTLRPSDVAAVAEPAIGSIGPNYGIIIRAEDVTAAYTSADGTVTTDLPLYRGPRRAGKNEFLTRVPVGFAQPAKAYGADVVKLVANPDTIVEFRAWRVYEEVPRYRQEKVDLPAEEYIRPGWYGDAWKTSEVGKVYNTFFRTGSITDPTQIADAAGGATGKSSDALDDAVATAADGDTLNGGAGFDDPRELVPALLTLEQGSSIAQAVAFLVTAYSYVRQSGLDTDEFIRAYTWRPIATLPDLFGSSDLTFSADGLEVTKGIEGFHSRAFGPYDDLFGLVPPEVESVLDVKASSAGAKNYDTRKRKWTAVQDYVAGLRFSRAVAG